jgi:hypothetical protein
MTSIAKDLSALDSWVDHPLAALVPPMSPEEFDALSADILANGLFEPIVLYEGKILDGRHRYQACVDTGTEPRFREYEGEDPAGYVISSNVHRRHLSASQKAVVALDLERVYAVQARDRQGARTDLTSSQSWEKVRASPRSREGGGVHRRLEGLRFRREADRARRPRSAPTSVARATDHPGGKAGDSAT